MTPARIPTAISITAQSGDSITITCLQEVGMLSDCHFGGLMDHRSDCKYTGNSAQLKLPTQAMLPTFTDHVLTTSSIASGNP